MGVKTVVSRSGALRCFYLLYLRPSKEMCGRHIVAAVCFHFLTAVFLDQLRDPLPPKTHRQRCVFSLLDAVAIFFPFRERVDRKLPALLEKFRCFLFGKDASINGCFVKSRNEMPIYRLKLLLSSMRIEKDTA